MMAAAPNPAGATPQDWAHFDMLLGLGADLLPVVSERSATIAPSSAIKDLGKLPSTYNGQRQVVGFAAWTQHQAGPADLARWSSQSDYGICLQTRRIRALDLDITDADTVRGMRDIVERHVGRLPARTRANASKLLLAFELPGEFTKRKFKTEHGIVEFLATGQQFVAVGTHPSGARYAWEGGLPDTMPLLSPSQFEALWADLVEVYAVEDGTVQSASVKGQKLADVMSGDPVAQHLLSSGRVKRAERDGRMHITCPWETEHTSESSDSATTYWPAHTGGYVNGHFACLHSHCEHRTDQEFLDAIDYAPEALFNEFEHIADGGGDALEDGRGALEDGRGGSDTRTGDSALPEHDRARDISPGDVPARRFAVHSAHAFAAGKPTDWIIKGVVPKAELAVLFGESGTGKSFAALDMAVAIAMGTPWRGKRVRQGRVVYIAAEGAGGFRNRLRAIAEQRNIDMALMPMGIISDAPNMIERTDALDVAKAIHAAGGADIVFMDTWAQVTAGANENSGEDMGRALSHCKGIHRATGALVLLVHHSGKDSSKGARGWSGLRAAADVELEVVRNEDARSITVTKLPDGEDGAEFAFRLETVVLGLDADGDEITSCVVEHGEGRVSRARDKGPKGVVEKLVHSAMLDLAGLADGAVEHSTLKAHVISQLSFDPHVDKRDRRGERVERAIESLLAGSRVQRDGIKLRFVA